LHRIGIMAEENKRGVKSAKFVTLMPQILRCPLMPRIDQEGTAAMRSLVTIGALAGILLLSACGSDEPDRAQGGAATGAATGAAVGLVGGPIGVVVGGLIGGAAGATTGAVTSPQTVDLGAPPWSDKYGYQQPPQQPPPPPSPTQP
jgi:hypothetical protein